MIAGLGYLCAIMLITIFITVSKRKEWSSESGGETLGVGEAFFQAVLHYPIFSLGDVIKKLL